MLVMHITNEGPVRKRSSLPPTMNQLTLLCQGHRMHTWYWLANTCCVLGESESQGTWRKQTQSNLRVENELSVTHAYSTWVNRVIFLNSSVLCPALMCPQHCALAFLLILSNPSSDCIQPFRLCSHSTSCHFSHFVIKDKEETHPWHLLSFLFFGFSIWIGLEIEITSFAAVYRAIPI